MATRPQPPPGVLGSLVSRVSLLLTLAFIASIPIENARAIGQHSLARFAGLLAVAGTGLFVLVTGRVRVVAAVLVPALLFIGWAATSIYWSAAPDYTVRYVSTAVQLLLLVLVVWQQVCTPRRLRLAIAALIAGSTVGSLLTILAPITAGGGIARYAVGDPNDFGVMLAVTAVMTLHLLRTAADRNVVRLLLAAALVLQVIGVARTASRAATIAGVAGLIVLLVGRSLLHPRQLAGVSVLAAGAIYGVRHFVGSASLGRIGTAVNSAETGDLNNRTTFWHLAVDLWQRAPFQGVGAGAFRHYNVESGRERVAHSVFFGLLVEVGLIGITLFLLMIVMAARQLRFVAGPERRFWLAVFVTWLGAGLTLTFELRKMTWVLIALCGSVGLMRRADDDRVADDPELTTVAS